MQEVFEEFATYVLLLQTFLTIKHFRRSRKVPNLRTKQESGFFQSQTLMIYHNLLEFESPLKNKASDDE